MANTSDTRRRILVGAMLLDKAQKDAAFARELQFEMDASLTRPQDRALFDLPPLPSRLPRD